jgi:hypothetical protein
VTEEAADQRAALRVAGAARGHAALAPLTCTYCDRISLEDVACFPSLLGVVKLLYMLRPMPAAGGRPVPGRIAQMPAQD